MKNGISLVILVITIMIMVILLGIFAVNTSNVLIGTSASKLSVDISMLENLMNSYLIRRSGNIDFNETVMDISNISSSEIEQFSGETIQNNKITLYVIDYDKIDAEELNYGKLQNGQKDRYLYSLKTGKVYYEAGLTDGDNTYYRYVRK